MRAAAPRGFEAAPRVALVFASPVARVAFDAPARAAFASPVARVAFVAPARGAFASPEAREAFVAPARGAFASPVAREAFVALRLVPAARPVPAFGAGAALVEEARLPELAEAATVAAAFLPGAARRPLAGAAAAVPGSSSCAADERFAFLPAAGDFAFAIRSSLLHTGPAAG